MSVGGDFNLSKVKAKIITGITLYGKTEAGRMEKMAKQTAPWVDRTSNARNTIQGNFDWEGTNAVITLSGNVNYFIYLELANSKKYAVLIPTLNSLSPQILNGYRKLVG